MTQGNPLEFDLRTTQGDSTEVFGTVEFDPSNSAGDQIQFTRGSSGSGSSSSS
jgi:hypothetical protein